MSKSQLKAGALLNYIVILLNTIVGLLYTPYMLRMMGHSEYGLYSLVASVIAYLTILDFGFGNAIVRYTAKYRAEGKIKEQHEMFGMFLILYSFIGIIAFGAGLTLYFNVEKMFGNTMTIIELKRARVMMLVLIFNLAYTFPMSIFKSIITAYEHFVFPKMLSICRIILNTIIMVLLLRLGYRAIAMVILQTIFNVLTLFLEFLYCKYKLHIKIQFGKFKWGFLKEVSIYSFWIFLGAIIDRIYWSTGQFVLGIVSGTAAISIFAVAIQLHTMYMQFSTAISSVFLPKVTGMVATKMSNLDISNLFIRTGRIQNIVMITILSVFVVFGKKFIILWAGDDYSDAYLITLCFFISLYIPLIQNLGITILQARNQMKFRSLLYIIIAVVSLVFQFLLAKKWGGLGCAIAISGALIVGQGLIMNIYYTKKQNIDIVLFWKEIFKMDLIPFVLTLLFIFLMHFINLNSWFRLFGGIMLFLICYIPLFYFFSFNQSERRLFVIPFKSKTDR